MYEQFKTVYGYICSRLFSVSEDGFGTRRMTSLCKLFGGYQDFEEKFQQPKARSYTTDAKLKGGQPITHARKKPSFVVHIDTVSPVWFTKFT